MKAATRDTKMKIAVISDIHGNLPALESALNMISGLSVDLILGAGDWVGYGPFPGEVIERLKAAGVKCIRGNYDVKVLNARKTPAAYSTKLKPYKWNILDWTLRKLSREHLKWIRSLPDSRELAPVQNCCIRMFHGSPEGNEGRIYPSITDRAIAAMSNEPLPDILIAGHTHIPFVKEVEGCLIMNPGSTGQPVDGDPRPTFGLLEINEKGLPFGRIIRFDYPEKTLQAALKQAGLPKWLAKDFQTGKKRK